MNCYRVYTLARSAAHRTIRRVVRHVAAHPVWIVAVVCVGVPLATLPLVPWDATNATPVDDHYVPWSDRGEWPVDLPVSIPCPGSLVMIPAGVILALSRRKQI